LIATQDFHIVPFDVTLLTKPSPECGPPAFIRVAWAEITDHWHCPLLRERQCRRAAERGDEFASSKANARLPLPFVLDLN
jgi:hypothetical protein